MSLKQKLQQIGKANEFLINFLMLWYGGKFDLEKGVRTVV